MILSNYLNECHQYKTHILVLNIILLCLLIYFLQSLGQYVDIWRSCDGGILRGACQPSSSMCPGCSQQNQSET